MLQWLAVSALSLQEQGGREKLSLQSVASRLSTTQIARRGLVQDARFVLTNDKHLKIDWADASLLGFGEAKSERRNQALQSGLEPRTAFWTYVARKGII
jgi:hypothetical protein